jgi:hypothetical protein
MALLTKGRKCSDFHSRHTHVNDMKGGITFSFAFEDINNLLTYSMVQDVI